MTTYIKTYFFDVQVEADSEDEAREQQLTLDQIGTAFVMEEIELVSVEVQQDEAE